MAEISSNIRNVLEQASRLDAIGALKHLKAVCHNTLVFSTSFGKEDQVITDLIHSAGGGIRIFTLDTGRLFAETYSVWTATLERYGLPISVMVPEQTALESYIGAHGPNAFYASTELRKECCRIRKVEPLKRALAGAEVWITGIRAAQSPNRQAMSKWEWDEGNKVFKFHPLMDWTDEDVDAYILSNNVPYNVLHDRGFPSIGCAPCTRAVRPGEDPRAGRWWWESNDKKECGLHQHASGDATP
jgi:phosphoadenosine phosphosulfate reductase